MATNRAPARRLYRSRRNRIIAGVAGGIADYFGIDATIVRVVWVLLTILMPPALLIDLLVYIVLVIVVPPEPIET